MFKYLEIFERVIVSILIMLMAAVILMATLDLAWIILRGVTQPPYVRLPIDELLDVFGMFLLVLVGLELLETIRAYLSDHVVHVEVVFTAAMIALARKIIIFNIQETAPLMLIGIAAMLAGLSSSYYLYKRTHGH